MDAKHQLKSVIQGKGYLKQIYCNLIVFIQPSIPYDMNTALL